MTIVTITVKASDTLLIKNATVNITPGNSASDRIEVTTDKNGIAKTNLPDGTYTFSTEVFGKTAELPNVVISGDNAEHTLEPDLGTINIRIDTESGDYAINGEIATISVDGFTGIVPSYSWSATAGEIVDSDDKAFWQPLAGHQTLTVTITDDNGVSISNKRLIRVFRSAGGPLSGESASVNLGRSVVPPTNDQALWIAISSRNKAINFSSYTEFIDAVLCDTPELVGSNRKSLARQRSELYEPIHGVGAYELLKTATQVFLLMECGTNGNIEERLIREQGFNAEEEARRLGRLITLDEARNRLTEYLGDGRLPYINRVLRTAFKGRPEKESIFCEGIIASRVNCPPLLELIWSYWHEEAMLVQTMNAISLRFQNRRSKSERDPLAHLEIAPLYPLNNLLWGYLQDEVHSLSVTRRNYEYNHHYGLNLQGTAVSDFRPVDPRSRFLEGFHNLLQQTARFYKQDDDTTFLADGFPLLNSLREVHLVLAEGAHNQYGDLPWTARAEMLMQQWLLSRPELREFLQSRAMVPYRESWMPQVDTMKQLQGWTDVSVTHFNYLAVYGERILLSIRYGDWVEVADPTLAANWARYWRPEIQNYVHSYRAATGVDLAAETKDSRQEELRIMQPSKLLQQRLKHGQPVPAVSSNGSAPTTSRFRQRRAARAAINGSN